MARRLLNLLTALSLVLCVAVIALWMRSHWRSDRIAYVAPTWTVSLGSKSGSMRLSFATTTATTSKVGWRVTSAPFDPDAVELDGSPYEAFGYTDYTFSARGDTARIRLLRMPHWSATLQLLLLPFGVVIRMRRSSSRIRRGLCSACGCDLRATRDRCPECAAENRAIISN